jgi:membrane protein implicated in regulation of membrane protease activity
MDETTRPLTPDERRMLERLRTARPQGGAGFAAFLAFIVTLGVLLIVSPASWQVGPLSLSPVAAALVVAVYVYRRMQRSPREGDRQARIARDLLGGVARVVTYRVSDALQVEEAEDEGSSYYLKLDDGRVAFLSGQYLYDAEEDGTFPSTVVSVVRAPHTDIVFDLRCEGTAMGPAPQLPAFTTADWDQGRVPNDGALVDVDFEALRRRAQAGPR